jgi:hypothetical protein
MAGNIEPLGKQVFVLPVAFRIQLVGRYKAQGRGIHAVAFAGGRGAVVKHVAQVGAGNAAAHFSAGHKKADVGFFHHPVRDEGPGEAGPARSGLEFVA